MEEVQDLIFRYLDGELGEKDSRALLDWVNESPENKETLFSFKEAWLALNYEKHRRKAQPLREWKKLSAKVGGQAPDRRKRRWMPVAVAAALAVGVLGGWFVNMVAQRNVPETVAVSTGTGQHAETILPDGTKVTLDPCSRLTYSLTDWKKQRHVSLCGEGFFDVTGDPGRPFTVGTSGFDVKVLGTVFKVSAYEDETEGSVVLKSGRVQILFPGDDTGVALAAGDLCTFNNETGSYRITKAAENDLASWKTYELRFDGKELHEMTGELYRHFGYTFILSDDVRKLVYKATVRDESLRDFLRILETVTPQLVTRTDKESRTVYLSLR